jgi:serine protease Do
MLRFLIVPAALLAGVLLARVSAPGPAVATPAPPDFVEVVAACDGSVVTLTTQTHGSTPRSRDDNVGAGFVVAADGWILTNRHVVSGARTLSVGVPGRGVVPGRVHAVDEVTDVALVKVELAGLVPLATGDPNALRKGEWVLAAGSPYRLENSWSVGIVSGLARSGVGVNPRGYQSYIQTDAAANLGNSGGPLVDARGRVVGVVTAILSHGVGSQGVTLAVPIDVAMRSVSAWLSGARPRRASAGLAVRAVEGGLLVTEVTRDSPAERAGLEAGDLVVGAGGRVATDASQVLSAWWALRSGESLPLRVRRGAEILALSLTAP